jgi:hypothetical protein
MKTKTARVFFFLTLVIVSLTIPYHNDSFSKSQPIETVNAPSPGCRKLIKFEVGGVPVWEISGSGALLFVSGMAINADGAPNTYHPDDKGMDFLANAGTPGNWRSLVTHNGRTNGIPVVQGPSDPFPGFYISTTALFDPTQPITKPGRYVDSRRVPYFVLPMGFSGGARLGDLGVVINLRKNLQSSAIYADIGPCNKIGEGSIRLANNLGIDSDPRQGGVSDGIAYLVFPDSGNNKFKPSEEIESQAMEQFERWGGIERLRCCLQ